MPSSPQDLAIMKVLRLSPSYKSKKIILRLCVPKTCFFGQIRVATFPWIAGISSTCAGTCASTCALEDRSASRAPWRRSWTPSACQGLSSTAPAHRIKPRGNSQPVQPVQLVQPVPGGKDISAPAEDLLNQNPLHGIVCGSPRWTNDRKMDNRPQVGQPI